MATATLNTSDWRRAIKAIRQKAPVRIARALNRSATTVRADMARNVSKDMGVKTTVAKAAMKIEKASGKELRAQVISSGKRIPLKEFGAKGTMPSRGKGRGVTARIGGTRKRYPHAFLAKMRSGHVGVFSRSPETRGPRLPIKELHGPSIPHVFMKLAPEGAERGNATLVKNLEHEIQFLLQQVSSK